MCNLDCSYFFEYVWIPVCWTCFLFVPTAFRLYCFTYLTCKAQVCICHSQRCAGSSCVSNGMVGAISVLSFNSFARFTLLSAVIGACSRFLSRLTGRGSDVRRAKYSGHSVFKSHWHVHSGLSNKMAPRLKPRGHHDVTSVCIIGPRQVSQSNIKLCSSPAPLPPPFMSPPTLPRAFHADSRYTDRDRFSVKRIKTHCC